mmetsp:Transcript_2043/g.13187  ORF Transcript_2043/g.13187 Transcript_2043/m.13187 type:complete len:231 (-) Transcript_2043:10-702(-)
MEEPPAPPTFGVNALPPPLPKPCVADPKPNPPCCCCCCCCCDGALLLPNRFPGCVPAPGNVGVDATLPNAFGVPCGVPNIAPGSKQALPDAPAMRNNDVDVRESTRSVCEVRQEAQTKPSPRPCSKGASVRSSRFRTTCGTARDEGSCGRARMEGLDVSRGTSCACERGNKFAWSRGNGPRGEDGVLARVDERPRIDFVRDGTVLLVSTMRWLFAKNTAFVPIRNVQVCP